jgi:hypothetical protein
LQCYREVIIAFYSIEMTAIEFLRREEARLVAVLAEVRQEIREMEMRQLGEEHRRIMRAQEANNWSHRTDGYAETPGLWDTTGDAPPDTTGDMETSDTTGDMETSDTTMDLLSNSDREWFYEMCDDEDIE